MMSPSLWIIIGALLIGIGGGVGGAVATFGWNQWSVENQRSGLVKSVAGELLMNLKIITDPEYTETNENELSTFVIFPRLQTTALGGAISSGLFDREEDKTLLTHMSGLNELMSDFNIRLEFTEKRMDREQSKIKGLRKELRDGETRQGIIKRLQKLGALLMDQYGIKHSDTFFVSLDEAEKTD